MQLIRTIKQHEGDSPTMAETRANEIYGIKKRYVDLNLSRNVVELIMAFWTKGTQKQYSPHINRSLIYCIDSFNSIVNQGALFLEKWECDCFHEGVSYSMVNTARSELCVSITLQCHETNCSVLFYLNLYMFGQKDPIKVQIFRLSSARMKINKIPYCFFKPQSSFTLSFASPFNVMILNSSEIFFCTFLAATLYYFDERSPSKYHILDLFFTKFVP